MSTDSLTNFMEEVKKRTNNNFAKADVMYPNQKDFDPPEDDAWVKLIVREGNAQAIDMANKPTFRHPGILLFEVKTPLEQADRQATKISDRLAELFRFVSIDTTLFRTPSFETVGRVDEDQGAWYQMNVTIPYRRDSQFDV